jgi:hypothetical protein
MNTSRNAYSKRLRTIILMVIMAAASVTGSAQVLLPGSDDYDYFRILELRQDSLRLFFNHLDMIRYYRPEQVQHDSRGLYATTPSPNAIRVLPVQTRITWNSHYPRTRNNGAVWHGKGLTSEVHAGFQGNYGLLSVTFYPVVYYAQNKAFPLPVETGLFPHALAYSPWHYPGHNRLDYLLRLGPDPLAVFDPGQSDISVLLKNMRLGVSTQNMVVGPSWFSPILHSANAPGVRHFYVQNQKPIFIWIGDLEVKQMWGMVRESKWFDEDPNNDWRYFTGISAGWMPRYMDGLHLGFNRVFLKRGEEFKLFSDDIIATLWNFNSDIQEIDGFRFNDDYFQMTSITGRWNFPVVGFEAYFEYIRNDFGGGPFGGTPEHSRAYTLGFTKIHALPDQSLMALTGEVTTNGATRTERIRDIASYYEHSIVEHGYTNYGQLMGSYIGPGAMAYNVFIRRYTDAGMHGILFDYLRHFEDYYYRYYDHSDAIDREFSLGYRAMERFGAVDVGLTALVTWRTNMNLVEMSNVRQFHAMLSVKYRIGG